jgi:hypothetical protein
VISVCISAGKETGSKLSGSEAEVVAGSFGIALVLADSSVFEQPASTSEPAITREIHCLLILLKVNDI